MLHEQIDDTAKRQTQKRKEIKCVVWDLDNTVWDGVLLEDEAVTVRQDIVQIIKTLDARGILNSLASKNDEATAIKCLQENGIYEYFLYPQINWNAKSSSIQAIAKALNVSLDTFAFIDDQSFELDEVAFLLKEVLCINTLDVQGLLDWPEMQPRFITEDSAKRRLMYINDTERDKAEKEFVGPQENFLASLNMVFSISEAHEEDLQRVAELTVRTHQLNTTGYTYSYTQLNEFRQSDRHKLLIAGLDDKYGSYGKIGVALIECDAQLWTLKLLLMSCRVMSRSVGTIMINHIMSIAKEAGVRLQADFISNERNRLMLVTYKFSSFRQIKQDGNFITFENDLTHIQPFPEYVKVNIIG